MSAGLYWALRATRPLIPMDDALRQRLVGAAVIIALAVIFVPMLLDSPEDPARTQQVDLSIPPRTEPGIETRRLPLIRP